jgi:Spy/CpxP family protein refolding chaperone
MKATVLAAALAVGAFFTSATAQVKQTTRNQHHRIKQGVKSGELTKAETKNLVKDQREIRQDVKEAKADGTVTGAERKEIRQDKRQASRKIYRKKHNNRDRN